MAVKADGPLWYCGELTGDLDAKYLGEPRTMLAKNIKMKGKWMKVLRANSFTAIVDEHGNIWTFGINNAGQLGYGKTASSADPVKVLLPRPVISNASAVVSSKEETVLSQGATFLFKDVNCTLNIVEKNTIYAQLGFILAPDGKRFTMGGDAREHPFEAYVFPADLNKDGIEEIFILYGNSYTSGATGSHIIAFLKTSNAGKYNANLGFPGTLPDVLTTGNQGWPDLVIGGPGSAFPVWRWNGQEYVYFNRIGSAALAQASSENIETISKKHLNR